jgi:hypothetical protein
MGAENERSQTFFEWILALLEERFPWLGSGQDEPVGGAETVDELAVLYKSLIQQREEARRENGDPRAKAASVDTWRVYVQCADDSNGAGPCIDSLGEGRLL